MNVLVQRFSVQRYLTPAEMKNLAEVTGLTYKQVSGGLTRLLITCITKFKLNGTFSKQFSFIVFVGEDLVSEPKNEAEETSEGH